MFWMLRINSKPIFSQVAGLRFDPAVSENSGQSEIHAVLSRREWACRPDAVPELRLMRAELQQLYWELNGLDGKLHGHGVRRCAQVRPGS
jgi:hypothetical protein